MRVMSRHWGIHACLALLVGCNGVDFLEPVDPEGVSIELAVSGGLAGIGYSFVVDGSAGEVRGLTCTSGCDFEEGDVLALVSADQVRELALRLEDTGILRMDGRDFGSGCCDAFGLELTYRRAGATSRVRGTQDRFPSDLSDVVALLFALAEGRVPMLISPDTRDTDWPRDPYTLGEVVVEGLTLSVEVTYGGGCSAHVMDLVGWGGWLESNPVQIKALVTHDDGDEPCDALVTQTRRFDLQPLARAYEGAYGPIGTDRPSVILRLWDPLAAGPVGRLVEVRL
jgi:hypothetical protein